MIILEFCWFLAIGSIIYRFVFSVRATGFGFEAASATAKVAVKEEKSIYWVHNSHNMVVHSREMWEASLALQYYLQLDLNYC